MNDDEDEGKCHNGRPNDENADDVLQVEAFVLRLILFAALFRRPPDER